MNLLDKNAFVDDYKLDILCRIFIGYKQKWDQLERFINIYYNEKADTPETLEELKNNQNYINYVKELEEVKIIYDVLSRTISLVFDKPENLHTLKLEAVALNKRDGVYKICENINEDEVYYIGTGDDYTTHSLITKKDIIDGGGIR